MSSSPPPPARKRRLGEILFDAGLIDELQLKAALSEQRKWGGRLGRTLVEMGFVDESSMVAALARQLNIPAVGLEQMAQLPDEIVRWLRLDMAERYGVFPLGGDERQKLLHLATSDPANVEALQELEFHTGFHIEPRVAGSTAIEKAIRRFYYGERSAVQSPIGSVAAAQVVGPTYDLQPAPGAGAPQANVDPKRPPSTAGEPELVRRLDAISARLGALEKGSANQMRVLRALFDLMIEKGLITQDEYRAKVRKDV